MIRAASKLLAVVAAALALNLLEAAPILAQKTTLPPSLNTSKPQGAFIQHQLRIAVDLGRRTLAGLQALPADDSIPIDEGTLQNARDTYVLIRAARHGMELAKETSRFPDPVMEMAFKRVDSAWNLSRGPVDRASSAMNRQRYLEESVQSLSRAVQLLDQALVIMP
jgi:hypothetical protein